MMGACPVIMGLTHTHTHTTSEINGTAKRPGHCLTKKENPVSKSGPDYTRRRKAGVCPQLCQ